MSTPNSTTFVYFIVAGTGPIKIGVSDSPESRLNDLQTAHYKQLHLLYVIECASRSDAFMIETAFHRWYEEVCIRNEWFDITPSKIGADLKLLMALNKSAVSVRQCMVDREIMRIDERAEIRQSKRAGRATGEVANAETFRDGDLWVKICPTCNMRFEGDTHRQASNRLSAHMKRHANEARRNDENSTDNVQP